jgi:hypothetical protein
MAWETVECADCGDEYSVQMYGNRRDRDRRIRNWNGVCDECLEKQREKARQEAAEEAEQWGLPELNGSEKQIAWAITIRMRILNDIQDCFEKYDDLATDNRLDQDDAKYIERQNDIITALCENQSAAWWIDRRSAIAENLIETIYNSLPIAQEQMEKSIQKEVEAQATVRPETAVTETVAEIRIKENIVEIQFPEKRDDFRQTVRFKMGYTWNYSDSVWKRKIAKFSGPIKDRVSEIGHRLLSEGFCIRIFDQDLRERAVSGAFTPEITKWIKARVSGKHKDHFSIWWGKDHDYYRQAKRLACAQWDKPDVVVPMEQFEEVLGFAETHGFSISEGAKNLIDKAEETKRLALTVSVEPPKNPDPKPKSDGKPPVLEVPEHVDVADEFLD